MCFLKGVHRPAAFAGIPKTGTSRARTGGLLRSSGSASGLSWGRQNTGKPATRQIGAFAGYDALSSGLQRRTDGLSPLIGTANPEELAIMSDAFDNHCLQHNIVDESAREQTAHRIMLLFQGATTVEELKAGLDGLQSI